MNATTALAGIGITESDTGPYSYAELLYAMQDLLDNPPAEPETLIIPFLPMKTYQYQHADGRTTAPSFSSDRTALQFLEAIGPKWQLLTPICDAHPIAEPPAHPQPAEAMREAAMWVQAAMELLSEGPHPAMASITEALQTALGRLNGAAPARVAPSAPTLVVAAGRPSSPPRCSILSCGNCGTCGKADAPLSVVTEPTVPYGQPDAAGHNQAAADHGFAS